MQESSWIPENIAAGSIVPPQPREPTALSVKMGEMEETPPYSIPIEVVYMRGAEPLEIERNWYFGCNAGPYHMKPERYGAGPVL